MLSRIALIGALVLSCSAATLAQQSSSPEAYIDDEAYRVYDALLPQDSTGSTFVMQGDTFAKLSDQNSHSFGPEECIDPGVAADFKDAITDYNRANQNRWLLQRKFSTQHPYEILDAATLAALFKGDGWTALRQRFPNAAGMFEMSAVGFNKDKTRAILYFGHSCGSLCGDWSFHLLKKVESKWTEVPGVMCHTMS